MNAISIVFLGITSLALLLFPRRLAALPLLMGACYMTLAQGVSVGPFSFPVLRILVAVGLARVLIRREHFSKGMNRLDWVMVLSGICAIGTSGFHTNPIFSFGLVYNTCGIYFLLRVWCHTIDDTVFLVQATAFILIPVALEMLVESLTQQNMFAVLGGVPLMSEIREGRLRAQGPFLHSILAGTVGAVCFPLMIGLWRIRRGTALVGVVACLMMVVTSASSGPVASVLAAIVGLLMWKWREWLRVVRWSIVLVYIALDVVMKAPPYFLMARIDLVGGSGGWHRAELIDSASQHFGEWWLWGTDYTRHWMPTGVTWSVNHTDITNYYLHLGVTGGLPLMLAFIWSLVSAYSFVGRSVRHAQLPENYRFMIWTLGAGLFAHTASDISVSYFDQSFLFLYLNLAVIGSAYGSLAVAPVEHRTRASGAAGRLASRTAWPRRRPVQPRLGSGRSDGTNVPVRT